MSHTSIIDLRAPRDGWSADHTSRVSPRLLEYAGAIVESLSACWQGPIPRRIGLGCRRRPRHRPCKGHLEVFWIDEHVDWRCPCCADAGTILNWRDGRHDLSGVAVDGIHDAQWRAALLTGSEYAALLRPQWAFEKGLRRVLRAARPTRPGIRIEAPEAVWLDLIMETAQRALARPRTNSRRQLRSAWHRFVDANRDW